jgi:hypothetical protein
MLFVGSADIRIEGDCTNGEVQRYDISNDSPKYEIKHTRAYPEHELCPQHTKQSESEEWRLLGCCTVWPL